MSSLPSTIVSIDIAKDCLDTDAWPRPWRHRLANTAEGVAEIVAHAQALGAFVVFEATSVYDRRLQAALERAGIAYHRPSAEAIQDAALSE